MSPAGGGPGLVLVNGASWAGSAEVEALAIRGDRIVAVGSKEESEAEVDRDVRTIDLGGYRVVPGLIDSHVHFLRAGIHWVESSGAPTCTNVPGGTSPPTGRCYFMVATTARRLVLNQGELMGPEPVTS